MATNPMKRRERNAALIGALLAFALMGLVVFFIYTRYTGAKKQLDELKARQSTVIVAAETIESGASISEECFIEEVVITNLSPDEYFTNSHDILYQPSEENENEEYALELIAKIEIPAGTIITPNMFVESGNEITADMRVQEYSSIALPSQLKNGDYIDVRLAFPNGQDYIVLSKKEVVQTDANTVWMNVSEDEILLLNGAMIDAWTVTGTKLYAIEYIDAGSQESAITTYKPSAEVMDLILSDPNVTKDARDGLAKELNSMGGSAIVDEFRDYIDGTLSEYIENRDKAAEEGFKNEITTMQTHRADYVEALEGTGKIGNDEIIPVE